jgi:hypothetical protein
MRKRMAQSPLNDKVIVPVMLYAHGQAHLSQGLDAAYDSNRLFDDQSLWIASGSVKQCLAA